MNDSYTQPQQVVKQVKGIEDYIQIEKDSINYMDINKKINELKELHKQNQQEQFDQDFKKLIYYLVKRQQGLKSILTPLLEEELDNLCIRKYIEQILQESNQDLRIRFLFDLCKKNPVPLTLNNNILNEIDWIITQENPKILLSFGLGNKLEGKSEFLNNLFGTDFETSDHSNYFKSTADLQGNLNFFEANKRDIYLIDVHGQSPNENLLNSCLQIADYLMIQVKSNSNNDYTDLHKALDSINNQYNLQQSFRKIFITLKDSSLQSARKIKETELIQFSDEDKNKILTKQYSNLQLITILRVPNKPKENVIDILRKKITKDIKEQEEESTQTQSYRGLGREQSLAQLQFHSLAIPKNPKNQLTSNQDIIPPKSKNFLNLCQREYISYIQSEIQQICDAFLQELKNAMEEPDSLNKLTIYKLYTKYHQKKRELTKLDGNQVCHERGLKFVKEQEKIQEEIDNFDFSKNKQKLTSLFQNIMLSGATTIKQLHYINKQLLKIIQQKVNILREKKKEFINAQELLTLTETDQIKKKSLAINISQIDQEIQTKQLSVEVFTREIVQLYKHPRGLLLEQKQELLQNYFNYQMTQGQPFEIIDGDHFEFNDFFLDNLSDLFNSNSKIFVISIVGPQNTGKSTLLNFLFGCLFSVADGRCTKGIYGTLIKCKIPGYDYLLILDTEGLQSVETQNFAYDRQITLFCLVVSHMVIINVRDSINEELRRIFELCLDSFKHFSAQKLSIPSVYMVLNQKADIKSNSDTDAITRILGDLDANDLKGQVRLTHDNFVALPTAFSPQILKIDAQQENWKFLKTQPDFIKEVHKLATKVFNTIIQDSNQSANQNHSILQVNFKQWIKLASAAFKTISQYPDISRFADIRERQADKELRQKMRKELEEAQQKYSEKQFIEAAKGKNEEQIKREIIYLFNKIKDDLENKQEELFISTVISDHVKKLNKDWLDIQINSIKNQWLLNQTILFHKKKLTFMVKNGDIQLRDKAKKLYLQNQNLSVAEQEVEFEKEWTTQITISENSIEGNTLEQSFMEYLYQTYSQYEENLPGGIYLHSMAKKVNAQDHTIQLTNQQLLNWFCKTYNNIQQTYDSEIISQSKVWNFFQQSILQKYYNIVEQQLAAGQQFLNQSLNQSRNFSQQQQQQIITQLNEQFGLELSVNWNTYHQNGQLQQNPNLLSIKSLKQINTQQFYQQQQYNDDFQNIFSQVINRLFIESDNIIWEFVDPAIPYQKIKENIFMVFIDSPVDRQFISNVAFFVQENVIKKFNEDLSNFGIELTTEIKGEFHLYAIWLLYFKYYNQKMSIIRQPLEELKSKKNNLKNYFLDQFNSSEKSKKVAHQIVSELKEELKKIILQNLKSTKFKEKFDLVKDNYTRRKFQMKIDQSLNQMTAQEQEKYITDTFNYLKEAFQQKWRIDMDNLLQSCEKEFQTESDVILKIINRLEYLQIKLKEKDTDVDNVFNVDTGDFLRNSILKGQAALNYVLSYLKGDPELQIESNQQYIKNKIQLPDDKIELDTFLVNLFRNLQNSNRKNSIPNINSFIYEFIQLFRQCSKEIKLTKLTFSDIDEQGTLESLARNLTDLCDKKCPCCGRLCDVDHSGQDFQKKHGCQLGHQLRAFNGYKSKINNEASIRFCHQMQPNDEILYNGKEFTWKDFVKEHKEWDFDFKNIDKPDLQKVELIFKNTWQEIGKKICEKYDMTFVNYNTGNDESKKKPDNLHYILCLDSSDSMKPEWDNLIQGVDNFLKIRRDTCHTDLFSIILFSDIAKIVKESSSIQTDKITIEFLGGGTNFTQAFKQVYQLIKKRNTEAPNEQFQIIFMTDGYSEDPTTTLQLIKKDYGEKIYKVWAVPYGEGFALDSLIKILQAEEKRAEDADELKQVFKEIARS